MLEAANLTKRFGGLAAVDDASLMVPAGAIAALIGPNGAGKTTMFAMIAGFVAPDRGVIRLDGADITARGPEAICRLGLVRTFQIVQPFGGLTVRDNIAVGAQLRRPSRRVALAHAETIAARLGMEQLLDRPARGLTVAQRKRLELARALATDPRVLLLDEVMAGLNPTEISEIVGAIRAIRDSGITILLIEHVMQAVASLAEQVHVLNEGHIIATGTPAAIARDPAVIEAYLGHGAARRLAAHGSAEPAAPA
ncbi:MAG: ABC transporter ATP-binding protein [Alphaproteobacteria bacterium]|nr:ABC transporter ATP-binding protein [Alphaproteobacteria bacterium]